MDEGGDAWEALNAIRQALEVYGRVKRVAPREDVIHSRGPRLADEAAELADAIKRLGGGAGFLRPRNRWWKPR